MAKKTDEDAFAELKIGEGDQSLRLLVHGQRMINGSLYRSIEAILNHLKTKGDMTPELQKAERENDDIPGRVAPFCN